MIMKMRVKPKMKRQIMFLLLGLMVSISASAAGNKRWSIGLNDSEGAAIKVAFGSDRKYVYGVNYGTNSLSLLGSSLTSSYADYTAYGLSASWYHKGYGNNSFYAKGFLESATVTLTVSGTNYSGNTVLSGGYLGYQSFWGWFSAHIGVGTRSPTSVVLNKVSGGGTASYNALIRTVMWDMGIAFVF